MPKVKRLGLLPYPKGALGEGPIDWTDWVAPELLHSFAKGLVMSGHALQADTGPLMRLQEMSG